MSSKVLTKEDLFKTRKPAKVEIEGLGSVYLKPFSAKLCFRSEGDPIENAYLGSLVDESGKPLFDKSEYAAALESIGLETFKAIIGEVNKLNKLNETEDQEKN